MPIKTLPTATMPLVDLQALKRLDDHPALASLRKEQARRSERAEFLERDLLS
jgi:hypothetical protein